MSDGDMKLDMAPLKSPSPNRQQGIAYLIPQLDQALKGDLAAALKPHGLTVQQFTLLSVIDAKDPLSNAQLARRSFMTPQSANEVVKVLEAKGLLTRTPDRHHGRIIRLQVTPLGQSLLEVCHRVAAQVEARMLDGLSNADRLVFHKLLQTTIAAFRSQTASNDA